MLVTESMVVMVASVVFWIGGSGTVDVIRACIFGSVTRTLAVLLKQKDWQQ